MPRALLLLGLLAAAGCAPKPAAAPARDTLSQRQRDSVIGQSALPGARGVQGALAAQDTAAARARALDSVAQ
jgi:hypothetical protein